MKDIDALLVFLEVAKRGSFTEAARHLNQPTTSVSRKVQQLEAELDVKLFHRTTRALSLTDMGARLLPKAQLIIETRDEMKFTVESHAHRPTGRLYISSSSTVLEQITPVMAEFAKAYPDVTFQLESSSRYVDLTQQGVDFAFRLGPLADSSLISVALAPLRYVLVAHHDLAVQYPALKHPSELANWPCIRSHIDGLLYPWQFAYEGETFSLETENFTLSNDLRVCALMMAKGLGVAYLPMRLVKPYLDSGQVVALLEHWMPADRALHLVYLNRQYLPSKAKVFIDFVRDHRTQFEKALNGGQ